MVRSNKQIKQESTFYVAFFMNLPSLLCLFESARVCLGPLGPLKTAAPNQGRKLQQHTLVAVSIKSYFL